MNQAEGEVNEDQHENQLAILEKSPAGGIETDVCLMSQAKRFPCHLRKFCQLFQ